MVGALQVEAREEPVAAMVARVALMVVSMVMVASMVEE
jgi:hypothetical protein